MKKGASIVQNELIPSNTEEARKQAEAEVKALVVMSRGIPAVIKNQAHLDIVTDYMQKIVTTKKSVTNQEKSVTKLLDAAKKGIRSWFLPMHERLDGLRGSADETVLDYEEMLAAKAYEEREKERKREAKRLAIVRRNEEKKLAEAKSKEERAQVKAAYISKTNAIIEEADAALNQIVEEKPQMQGVSIVKRWNVEVENWAEVPEEYFTMKLNEQKALEVCRAQVDRGQEPRIRGLRFFQVSGTAAKSLN
jgi:hypothetical protein